MQLRRRTLQTCTTVVGIIDVNQGGGDTTFMACDTADGVRHSVLSASPEWIEAQIDSGALKSGETQMMMPESDSESDIISGPPVLLPNVDSYQSNRRLAMTEGEKTVLVVRVLANNGAYSNTAATASNEWFGTGGGSVSLASQYPACSHGKLKFVPSVNGLDSSGVLTVNVNGNIDIGQRSNNERLVTEAVNEAFGVNSPKVLADHVVYCMPNYLGDGFLGAYAYLNSWLSVYSDSACDFATVQMHEIGHNLNLGHSGENDEIFEDGEYGDKSGVVRLYSSSILFCLVGLCSCLPLSF